MTTVITLSASPRAAAHPQLQELWPGQPVPAEPQGQGRPAQAPRDSLCPQETSKASPKCSGRWDGAQHPRQERSPCFYSSRPRAWRLSRGAMHLAQRQQSTLGCLLSPQTGQTIPPGLRGVNALLLGDGETKAWGPAEYTGGQTTGEPAPGNVPVGEERLPCVVHTVIPYCCRRRCETPARKANAKHVTEPARWQPAARSWVPASPSTSGPAPGADACG